MPNLLEREKLYLQERVLTYANDAIDGKRIECVKIKQAINRYFNDLKNEKYYMDWQEVLKFYRWMGMFKHTKGVLANQNIELENFQLWMCSAIYGIKHKSTGYRKHKEAYLQLGRKNAKSQLLSGMVSYQAFLSSEQEEVYISSWSRDQSNLVYQEALAQITKVDMLRGKYKSSYGHITVLKNGSIIKPLSREARKTGEGTNPSMAVMDEYKDNQTSELREVQRTGMMARPNRLLVTITTAGANLNYPCYEDYKYYERVLDPENDVENDEVFIAIYELDKDDDVSDERNWIKANPIVAANDIGMDSLRASFKRALDQPEEMRGFLTKNMNLWIDEKQDGYMSLKKWNNIEVSTDEVDEFLKEAHCYIGIDASMTTDLSSVAIVGVKDGRFAVKQHTFVPQTKFTERMSKDKVRYDIFEQKGYLTRTPGSVVDYTYFKEVITKWVKQYNIKEVAYDKWNLTMFAQELENDGYLMVEVPQSISQLSAPTKDFRGQVYEHKVIHDGDPLLRFAVSNAIVKMDDQENIMIGKKISIDRIDPLAAVINGFARARYDSLAIDLNERILSEDFSF